MNTHALLHLACAAALISAQHLGAQTTDLGKSAPQATASPDSVSAHQEDYVVDEVLVGFKPGAAAAQQDRVRASIGATKRKEFPSINVQHWKLPPGLTVTRAIEQLSANPNVRFAEPNYLVHTNEVILPNDEFRGDPWGMHNIGQNGGAPDADIDALEAWQLPQPSESSPLVVVGVIDSGIDYNHPDLAGKVLKNPGEIEGDGKDNDGNGYTDDVYGWDFANNRPNAMDDQGHGTHVAGTIAGNGSNGKGVIGVAGLNARVKVLPIKLIPAGGTGTTDSAISAVLYASSFRDGANQVKITNNS